MNGDGPTTDTHDPSYFILHGKDADGPYAPSEIRDQLLAGRLTGSSYCWNQTMAEWMPLRAVFDFAALSSPDADEGRTPPLAGFGRRFAGGAIDLVLIVFVFELAMLLLRPFRGWVEESSVDPAQLLRVNLILGALTYLYFLISLGPLGGGATLGYRVMGLRLVDQAHRSRPGWTQSLLWCLGSLSLPVGWPFYWFDRQHRMLHNGISQTLVLDIHGETENDTQRAQEYAEQGGPHPFLRRLAAWRGVPILRSRR